MLIVLDTNVLISGLLSPYGPPGRILDLALAGSVRLAYDDRILAEYRAVCARPKFGFRPDPTAALIDYLVHSGEPVLAPPLQVDAPHPGDLPFAEVAAASSAGALVTGNHQHFLFLAHPPVLSPADFLTLWGKQIGRG